MGVGAAMTGLRPIVEGMNMGFLLLAFSQISNNAGMLHYTSGGNYTCPMVIRGPGGASCCCAVTSQHVPILHPIHTGVGRQLGAEHSQRLESYFQAIPGMALGSRKSIPVVFCKGEVSGQLARLRRCFIRRCAAGGLQHRRECQGAAEVCDSERQPDCVL